MLTVSRQVIAPFLLLGEGYSDDFDPGDWPGNLVGAGSSLSRRFFPSHSHGWVLMVSTAMGRRC